MSGGRKVGYKLTFNTLEIADRACQSNWTCTVKKAVTSEALAEPLPFFDGLARANVAVAMSRSHASAMAAVTDNEWPAVRQSQGSAHECLDF
jgi:hypothetical protein